MFSFSNCRTPRMLRRPTLRSVPRLEALEERALPSTVTTLADSGAGSLRDAIASTPSGGTIDFADYLSGTIALTANELAINKDLTIAGPGADVIAVSGGDQFRVFDVGSGSTVSLSGLTITHGYGFNGGAILCDGSVALTQCVVSGSTAQDGGGIYSTGTVTITDTTVTGNTAQGRLSGRGGGIYSDDMVMRNTIVADNTGRTGGGIFSYRGTVTMTDTTVTGNTAGVVGGIFFESNGGTVTMTNTTVTGNTGGGIDNGLDRTVTMTDTTVTGNTAGSGGGISNRGTMMLAHTTVADNTAQLDGGGISNYSTMTITDTSVIGNTARQQSGGGIFIEGGNMTITDTIVDGNTAGEVGGGIFSKIATVTITGTTVTGNTAQDGGGIACSSYFTVTITGTTVTGNTARESGGGLSTGYGTVTMTDTTVTGNTAQQYGGGIYGNHTVSELTMTATNCTIAENATDPVSGVGGGIYFDGTSMRLTNCTLSDNTARTAGGIEDETSGMTLVNCTLTANRADLGGGMKILPSLSPQLLNTIVAGNLTSSGTTPSDISGLVASSSSYNLIGPGGSGGLIDGVNGNQVGVSDPGLGSLGDYGGPTRTVPVLAGSPALNAGTDLGAPPTDQRHVPRGPVITIGAYQATASAFTIHAPILVAAGQQFMVVVTAVDLYGQVAAGYTGTAHLDSTDPAGVPPPDYTFHLSDGGSASFEKVVLNTPGPVTLTVTDVNDNTITGSVDFSVIGLVCCGHH